MAPVEVDAGKIDRYGKDGAPFFEKTAQVAGCFMNDVEIELRDEACFFQDRYEERRREEAPLRIVPAGEGFQTADFSGEGAHHRLVVHFDPVIFKRFFEIAEYIGLVFQPVPHGFIVERPDTAGFGPDGDACQTGQVKGVAGIFPHLFFPVHIVFKNACFHGDGRITDERIHGSRYIFQLFSYRRAGREDTKFVGPQMAGDGIGESFREKLSQMTEDLISCIHPMMGIVELEIGEIDINRNPGTVGAVLFIRFVDVGGLPEEGIGLQEAG